MPVRAYVTGVLAEKIRGVHVFNGLSGESETITRQQLDYTREVADSIYLRVVQLIDWNRVMLEAHIIHMKLDHPDWEKTCGLCVKAALLTLDRNYAHSAGEDDVGPDLDEVGLAEDWPAGVAQAVTLRHRPVCGVYFGEALDPAESSSPVTGATCTRPKGHPEYIEDLLGHSSKHTT